MVGGVWQPTLTPCACPLSPPVPPICSMLSWLSSALVCYDWSRQTAEEPVSMPAPLLPLTCPSWLACSHEPLHPVQADGGGAGQHPGGLRARLRPAGPPLPAVSGRHLRVCVPGTPGLGGEGVGWRVGLAGSCVGRARRTCAARTPAGLRCGMTDRPLPSRQSALAPAVGRDSRHAGGAAVCAVAWRAVRGRDQHGGLRHCALHALRRAHQRG